MQATLHPRVPLVKIMGPKPLIFSIFCLCSWRNTMILFLLLVLVSVRLSKALSSPSNSSVLQLPTQDTIITIGKPNNGATFRARPWPDVPFERLVHHDIMLNVTAYGDTLSTKKAPYILQALIEIQQHILVTGEPDDTLIPFTSSSNIRGRVFVDIGFYALHPPAGIKVAQAGSVIYSVRQLLMEHYPPKEITMSSVRVLGEEVALFRLSFRGI